MQSKIKKKNTLPNKSSKNQSKINKLINKSTKHRSTIYQNRLVSTKIPPGLMGYPRKPADGVLLFWSRAQVVLDLGALLGSSWRRPETVLEASWAVLGIEKGGQRYGSNLASQNISKNRRKIGPKIDQSFKMPLGIGMIFGFSVIFGAYLNRAYVA